jgi:hypothetical protein
MGDVLKNGVCPPVAKIKYKIEKWIIRISLTPVIPVQDPSKILGVPLCLTWLRRGGGGMAQKIPSHAGISPLVAFLKALFWNCTCHDGVDFLRSPVYFAQQRDNERTPHIPIRVSILSQYVQYRIAGLVRIDTTYYSDAFVTWIKEGNAVKNIYSLLQHRLWPPAASRVSRVKTRTLLQRRMQKSFRWKPNREAHQHQVRLGRVPALSPIL